jgi:hypothetical protein
MAIARVTITLAVAALTALGALPTPAGADPARGILGGDPHTVRLRPVLGAVAAERAGRAPHAAREQAAAAVAACDVTRTRAFRAAPGATARADPVGSCVVAATRDSRSRGARLLLGPATITGSDLERVRTVRGKGGAYAMVLHVLDTRAAVLDGFVTAHFHGKAAVTLDGEVVATIALEPDAPAFVPLEGTIRVGLAKRFSGDAARGVQALFTEAQSEQLVDLLGAATMTPEARRIVASVTASVDDKARFAKDCPVREMPDSLVLGCFGHSTLRVLRVDRPDLAPVMVVSAAHEMLHGAYQQLGRKERARIDHELDRVYASLDDPQLAGIVAAYDHGEPGQRLNELHSLLATQVATLSPALERYYRRYFADRRQVVAAFRSYERVFVDLRHRHDALQTQLDEVHASIDATRSQMEAAAARADDLGSRIDSLRAEGRIGESNDLVGAQNDAAGEANALVDRYNSFVDRYNALAGQANSLAASARDLYDSVSAVPSAPAP